MESLDGDDGSGPNQIAETVIVTALRASYRGHHSIVSNPTGQATGRMAIAGRVGWRGENARTKVQKVVTHSTANCIARNGPLGCQTCRHANFGGSGMQIEAIIRHTTADLVVERIAHVIKARKLSAGERLPGEHELVEQLKVSRPVLREALARLQSMGLVDIQRGRGTFVGSATSLANCVRLLRSAVTISPQELRSYAELRSAIEVQAARQAAERANEEDISELSALLKRLDDDELPYAEALELDFQFHRKLLDMAGNPLMRNLMEVIYEFVLTQMARTTPSQRDNQLGRRLHKAILTAVRNHDPDAAAKAMQQHMQAVLKRLEF